MPEERRALNSICGMWRPDPKFFILAIFLLCVGTFLLGTSPPRGDFLSQVLEIPQGMSGEEIGHLLAKNSLLRSKSLFKIILKIKRSKLQAGEYVLNNRMNLWQILKILEEGKIRLYKFTIPEGFSLQEIAKDLAKQKLANPQKFLRLTRNKELLSRYNIPGERLEGFLFPDTYKVPKGMKERDLIELMLKRFEEVIQGEFKEKLEKQSLPLYGIVTLASVIEKEAVIDEEKPLISGVFHNRLAKGMRLQSDPTVKYVLPKSRKNLYYKDLEIDSPYNTYLHKGLPHGPICSPGKASLKAALAPASTDYLYFVSKNDGTHYFSCTFSEHLVAKRRYQK
jgi:UPF0755 protein